MSSRQKALPVMSAAVLLLASISTVAQDTQVPPGSHPPAEAPAGAHVTPPSSAGNRVVPSPTPMVVLKENTEIPLKFSQSLHSRAAKAGDTIEFQLAEDLKVADAVVVKKGARALGSVTRSNNPNSLGRGGELYLRVEFLKAGRSLIKVRGDAGGKQGRHICWVCGVGGLPLLGGVGGLVLILGSGGKQYVIKEGTPITAYVAEDIELAVLTE